jgi:hypothetical protein
VRDRLVQKREVGGFDVVGYGVFNAAAVRSYLAGLVQAFAGETTVYVGF